MSVLFREAPEQNITPKRCEAMATAFEKNTPQGLEKIFARGILPSRYDLKVLKAKEFCILEKSSQNCVKKLNKQDLEDKGRV